MRQEPEATATAHPNVALVKYWGKRDEQLVLPHQTSLSVTVAPLAATATVRFFAERDEVLVNGRLAEGEVRARVLGLMALVRTARHGPVHIETAADFPSSAGLASSAAAFAALALAARTAVGLPNDVRETSLLARRGSGSACRSVQGGFCVWNRGTLADGTDSFAEQLFSPGHWPALRLIAAVLTDDQKEVSSREGMRRTVETSPFYSAWVEDAEGEVARARLAVECRDLPALGELCERNSWRMHACALGAVPPLCYPKPQTLRLIELAHDERRRGLPVWFTLDAGPNPFLLTDEAHQEAVEALARAAGACRVIRGVPGGDAAVVDP